MEEKNNKQVKFNSPFDQYKARNGESATILGKLPPEEYDFKEVGVIYTIKFKDETIIQAYPEELRS